MKLDGKGVKEIYEAISQRDFRAPPMSSGLCTTRLKEKMDMLVWRSILTWLTTPEARWRKPGGYGLR